MRHHILYRNAHGSVVVEVAISTSLFLLMIFAIIEFSRYMLTWNAASEATRLGARLFAAGCSDTGAIQNKMRAWGSAGGYNVPENWLTFATESCGTGCQLVRVSIKQSSSSDICRDDGVLTGRLMLPGLSDLTCLPIPAFTATAIRESGGSCS